MTVQVEIAPDGSLNLPAGVRERLGLTGGGAVLLEETPDGVVLRTTAQAVARAQALSRALLADQPDATVDAFLRERADEWRGA